jgi:hypothetical protein
MVMFLLVVLAFLGSFLHTEILASICSCLKSPHQIWALKVSPVRFFSKPIARKRRNSGEKQECSSSAFRSKLYAFPEKATCLH